jgi:pimeloyl-ACP methyl ester carboxylesterase
MSWGRKNVRTLGGRGTLFTAVVLAGAGGWSSLIAQGQTQKTLDGPPRFVELPCNPTFGSTPASVDVTMRCGTVTVPQDRAHPKDSRLMAVVLPVVVFSTAGANGTPVMFLPGGPGESAIDAAERVLLETSAGQSLLREHPIIAFDRRGYSPVPERASPDLGTILFEPRARRDLAVKPLNDSLVRRAKALRADGVNPANFTTLPAVEDIADVTHALGYQKLIMLGASYGSRESLHFMRRHPDMVEASVLDGIAPPNATQILDSTYVATAGRKIAAQVVAECRSDSVCVTQYADLAQSLAKLNDTSNTPIKRIAQFDATDPWRTIQVAGNAILSVLGVASSDEVMRASVPRIITELASQDTLHDEFALRVFLAAAIDPSLQTASRQTAPLVYYIALCGDRPQGEPKAGTRMLCDALGVPFTGPEAIQPVTSAIPTLLISSGYDAQTPAALADEAAKTLSNARRAHFPDAGHVAFARPLVMACAALIMDSFLRNPHEQQLPTSCIGKLSPAFLPPIDSKVGKPTR